MTLALTIEEQEKTDARDRSPTEAISKGERPRTEQMMAMVYTVFDGFEMAIRRAIDPIMRRSERIVTNSHPEFRPNPCLNITKMLVKRAKVKNVNCATAMPSG
jgi:hypothetical protein